MHHMMPFLPSVILVAFVVRGLCFVVFYLLRTSSVGGEAGRHSLLVLFFSLFSRPRAGLATV